MSTHSNDETDTKTRHSLHVTAAGSHHDVHDSTLYIHPKKSSSCCIRPLSKSSSITQQTCPSNPQKCHITCPKSATTKTPIILHTLHPTTALQILLTTQATSRHYTNIPPPPPSGNKCASDPIRVRISPTISFLHIYRLHQYHPQTLRKPIVGLRPGFRNIRCYSREPKTQKLSLRCPKCSIYPSPQAYLLTRFLFVYIPIYGCRECLCDSLH